MNTLITSRSLTKELERLIPSCTELIVISAFITQPAVSWLCNLVRDRNVDITIVGRLSPKDLALGASDFKALQMCLEFGVNLYALENLHAKIYQIDQNYIFNGSANLTGKGLALIGDINIECCNAVPPTTENIQFIKKIINASTPVDFDVINAMGLYLESIQDLYACSIPNEWPLDVMKRRSLLFFSDFPLSKPKSMAEEYILNPDLPFARLETMVSDFANMCDHFKMTKAYIWLRDSIIEHQKFGDINFGKLSSLLHSTLADEPLPYRKDIKLILSNLLNYVEMYAFDEVKIYTPGARSQFLSLIN